MNTLRTTLALVLALAVPLPAFAAPHVVAQLGTAPLIGEIASTPQLQADVAREHALFETAGTKLGLTPREYAQFQTRIMSRQVSYVTIPRRLDAMSWSSGGRVYVLRDVVIPAQTKGWEVDLQEGHQVVALFVPARCGNLSLLRKALPALAKVTPPARRVAVEAAATAPPPPAAAPVAAAPAAAPAVQLPTTSTAPAAPYESVASSTPPTHHMGWWPLLLIPIVALFAGSHSSVSTPGLTTSPTGPIIAPPGGGGPPSTGPPSGGSTPPPVSGCVPTPAPIH